jgi:hypothetical protein
MTEEERPSSGVDEAKYRQGSRPAAGDRYVRRLHSREDRLELKKLAPETHFNIVSQYSQRVKKQRIV